jgi:hypothetical protein
VNGGYHSKEIANFKVFEKKVKVQEEVNVTIQNKMVNPQVKLDKKSQRSLSVLNYVMGNDCLS